MLEAQVLLDHSALPTPVTPDTPTHPRDKLLHARLPRLGLIDREDSPDGTSDDSYSLSSTTPSIHFRNVWTPTNTPRSVPSGGPHCPSTRQTLARLTRGGNKRPRDTTSSSDSSSPPLSPKSQRYRHVRHKDDNASESESDSERVQTGTSIGGRTLPSDEKAAFLLLSLRLQGPGPIKAVQSKKRRAST